MVPLPAGHLRLDDAARFVGRSMVWLAELAWNGEIPFQLLRTTRDAVPTCRDAVFAEADLVRWQNDGAVWAGYSANDRSRADQIVRRMVRLGLEVEGA